MLMSTQANFMSRRFLRSIAGVLIGVLLFAQMAIAAYVCPAMSLLPSAEMSSMALTHCEDMAMGANEAQNPNLCAEHCKYGQQSDHASTLTVPAALLMALYVQSWVPVPLNGLRPVAATTSALVAASPPRTILHCCFRI
jgi:hypothetical protein